MMDINFEDYEAIAALRFGSLDDDSLLRAKVRAESNTQHRIFHCTLTVIAAIERMRLTGQSR